MRILLVEDEEKLARAWARSLNAEGFAVDIALSGLDAVEMAFTQTYDLLILDIMLPGLDGTQVLRRVRQRDREIPVLMLTARDAVQDKVVNFEAGADDYLTKPFSFAEFLVRVKALLRRRTMPQANMLRAADFELDRLARRVRRGDRRIELSAKEFALLEYLALHAGRVLSRAMIIEHVWDQSFEGLTNIVDIYIRQLRVKLDEGQNIKLIHTVRGAGYMFSHGDAP